MKVPPKRKGNATERATGRFAGFPLNESPSEKEGKWNFLPTQSAHEAHTLNESPSEKEGKSGTQNQARGFCRTLNESPSEKEGKLLPPRVPPRRAQSLNESPSEKEGKSG